MISGLLRTTLVLLLLLLPAQTAGAQFYVFDEGDLTGEPAPDFTLDTVRTRGTNFTKYRDGQDAILFFWAVWCPNCGQYLKEIDDKRAAMAKEKIKVVAINIGDPKKQVEKYLKKHKIDMDIFLDSGREVEDAYKLYGVPTFYFVNGDGKVTAVRHRLPEDYHTLLHYQETTQE